MNMEEKIKEFDTLLLKGCTDDLLAQITFILEGRNDELRVQTFFIADYAPNLSEKNKTELYALRGMAYYRRKDFEHSRLWFTVALASDPANERALYGMAYLATDVDKSLEKTNEWIAKLPESAARNNVRMTILCSEEYIAAYGLRAIENEVMLILEKWLYKQNPEDPLNRANILHNAARFYITKGDMLNEKVHYEYGADPRACYRIAVGLLGCALGLYGVDDMNPHHRAAANYWLSVAMEKIFGPAAVIAAAEQSVELWSRLLDLDYSNFESWQNAAYRISGLRDAVAALH